MKFIPALIPTLLLGYAFKKHYDRKNQKEILIDAETLQQWQNKYKKNIKILNASFPMPVNLEQRKSIFIKERIPNAQFFDVHEIKDLSSKFPFMYPDQKYFQEMMKDLDIIPSDTIVIYDDFSLVGACRAWWLLKMYGAENVYILDGGFTAWKENNFDLDNEEIQQLQQEKVPQKYNEYRQTKYKKFKLNKNFIANLEQLKSASNYINSEEYERDVQILDARDEQNFTGTALEKFQGCKSGNIPGSQNLFWKKLLEEDSKSFKSNEEIKDIFQQYGVTKNVDVLLSCRTGMMASVLFVGLEIIEFKRKALYNASWLEFGTQND